MPKSHQALIEQIGVQDAVVDDWPEGVQAIYRSVLMAPPSARELSRAVAAWLPAPRVVAYNGPLLAHALGDPELAATTCQAAIDNIVWHEYGHALSATRASQSMKRQGVQLLELLPPGLRQAIDYPEGYRPRQVFDEVIANVYALMIGRVVQYSDYGTPDFLNPQVFEAFESVVPWPPSPR